MAYSAGTLLVLYGTLVELDPQPSDIWQVGLRSPVVADHDTVAGVIAPQINDWWILGASHISPQATLDGIKLADFGPTGQDPADNYPYATPQPGAGSGTTPTLCCFAITLETGIRVGKAQRGRIFLPMSIEYQGSAISTDNAMNLALSGAALLNAVTRGDGGVEGGTPTGFVPSVFSKIDGTANAVTAVSCDCIIDTQRRRKNALIPMRQTTPL